MDDLLKKISDYIFRQPKQNQAVKLQQLIGVFEVLRGITDGTMSQAIRAHESMITQPQSDSNIFAGIPLNMSKTNKAIGIITEPCEGCGGGAMKTTILMPNAAIVESGNDDDLADKIFENDRDGVIDIARKNGVTDIAPDMPLVEIAVKIQDKKSKQNVYTRKH